MPSNNKKLGLGDLRVLLEDQLRPEEDSCEGQLPPEKDACLDLAKDIPDLSQSPLQVLITESFEQEGDKELAKGILEATVKAEQNDSCKKLYHYLCKRTECLSDECIRVHFPWRLRVGGARGFRELILPVFHPVYGIPYVPSSSLKGFLRAWARKTQNQEINRLLGFLEGDQSAMAAVEILDAFPTDSCLEIDMANPQWAWQRDQVIYGTVPHPLLSMAKVTLNIGIVRTSLGTLADVQSVKEWIEQAFQSEGLGARTSAGYGQASRVNGKTLHQFSSVTHPHSSEHPFEFWSEGIHGANPKGEVEFRPVAVRGVLRYWFRAVALGLYSPSECRNLEQQVFGGIDPDPQEGSFKLITALDEDEEVPGDQNNPHHGDGKLILQTKQDNHLTLLQALLKLAFHIGGIGRGSRRPLHVNSGRLRGCFWQSTATDEQLPYNAQAWQDFLQTLLAAFHQVQAIPKLTSEPLHSPQQTPRPQPRTNNRTQDIFDRNVHIFLLPSAKLKHPSQVKDWQKDGNRHDVRGTGLDFFYNSGFKGVNRSGEGNSKVGGSLGTPSYVWIQSNGLGNTDDAYQVITLFGVSHPERAEFLRAINSSNQIKEKIEVIWPNSFS